MIGVLFKLFPAIWWVLKNTVLKDKNAAQTAVKVVKKGNGLFPFLFGAAAAAGAFLAAPYVKAAIQVYREDLANQSDADEEDGARNRPSYQNHENN